MRAAYRPENPASEPASCPPGGAQVPMRAGNVYDVPDEWAAYIISAFPGADGAPCLVPVDDGAEAAADFIAAVSEPTPLNPETPHAEASATAEPVKRGPGRPRKVSP